MFRWPGFLTQQGMVRDLTLLGLVAFSFFVTSASIGGTGTGFFVSNEGHVVTCSHVVSGAEQIEVFFQNQRRLATVVADSPETDLAILKADIASSPWLEIGDSDLVELGDEVFTIGFPKPVIQGLSPKFTKGNISSLKGIQDAQSEFQISVPIQPGNSGGALINESGQVVGVTASKLRNAENVNYAVKAELIRDLFIEAGLTLGVRRLDDESMIRSVEEATVFIATQRYSAQEPEKLIRFESWDHNGSTMKLGRMGDQLVIQYLDVRPGLSNFVKPGTELFRGFQEGNQISGLARRFDPRLGAASYNVKGTVDQNGKRIRLTGLAPIRNTDGSIKKFEPDELIFQAKSETERDLKISSYWNHNGSTVGLIVSDNKRAFVYVKVRSGLRTLVSPGDILFYGIKDGSNYTGVARRFHAALPPIEYAVSGPVLENGAKVFLKGNAPYRSKSGRIERTEPEELRFSFSRLANK